MRENGMEEGKEDKKLNALCYYSRRKRLIDCRYQQDPLAPI